MRFQISWACPLEVVSMNAHKCLGCFLDAADAARLESHDDSRLHVHFSFQSLLAPLATEVARLRPMVNLFPERCHSALPFDGRWSMAFSAPLLALPKRATFPGLSWRPSHETWRGFYVRCKISWACRLAAVSINEYKSAWAVSLIRLM